MRTRDESKEQAIKEKALEIIVKDGFDGLSMQQLAKAANVSPATIYLYYKNREDLLNQLFIGTEKLFAEVILKDFDPEMEFEEGMWQQWKNRFEYSINYPHNFCFMEQFRNSPLIHHKDIKESSFKKAMTLFFNNAIKRNEMIELPVEVFWSIAYAPLYTLIRFHQSNKSMMGSKFVFDEKKMKQAFQVVMKALKNNTMTYPTIELSKYSDNASIRNENDVYVLKTNILSQQDVTLLTRFLSEEYRIKKWSVDLNDIDRVFRVESQQLKLSDIQQLVHRAGYSCEELPD